MLISSISLICIGWSLGVHLPWWGIGVIWAACLYRVIRNKEGLGGIAELLIFMSVVLPMILSGFIYADVTFIDMGETIKYLFTGE